MLELIDEHEISIYFFDLKDNARDQAPCMHFSVLMPRGFGEAFEL